MSSKIRKTTEPSRDPLCNKILTLLSSQVGLAGWEEDASLMLMPMLFTWHLIGHMVVTINIWILFFFNLFCMFILNVVALGSHVAPHRPHGCVTFLQFAQRLHGHTCWMLFITFHTLEFYCSNCNIVYFTCMTPHWTAWPLTYSALDTWCRPISSYFKRQNC